MNGAGEFGRDRAWQIVLAACVGCAFGLSALPFYTTGLFAKSLIAEFGWPRATVQAAVSCALIGVPFSAGPTGWLIDRIGVRRVALGAQAGMALSFLALTQQNGNPWLWYANWFLMAIVGVGTTPLSWSRGIGAWFDRQRGLALGIGLTGSGITAFVAPLILTPLIAAHGWRIGYAAIAAAIALFAMPVVWALFRERAPASAALPAVSATGLTLREAIMGRRFWIILVAFALVTSAIAGAIPNLVPLLTDGGLDGRTAAGYVAMLGLAVVAGRLLAGWLLDRFWAPIVAIAILMPPAIACLLLAAKAAPLLSVILIGLAGGAEFDMIAYLCLRYFGTRNFGQIYAWQWAAFSTASAAGPIVFGRIYDLTGRYDDALFAATALVLIGPLLLLGLGRYPSFEKD